MINLPAPVGRKSASAYGGRGVAARRAEAERVPQIEPAEAAFPVGRRPKLPRHLHRERAGSRSLLAGLDANLIDTHTESALAMLGMPLRQWRAHAEASAAYRAAEALSIYYFHAEFPFDLKS